MNSDSVLSCRCHVATMLTTYQETIAKGQGKKAYPNSCIIPLFLDC